MPSDAHCGKEFEIWMRGIRRKVFYVVLYERWDGGMGVGEFRD